MIKLPPKQEAFVQELIKGSTQSDAYRKSYNTKKSTDKSIWELSSRLADKIKVKSRLAEIRKPVNEKIGYTLEAHIKRLETLSMKAANAGQFTAAVQAETNRGKASGHYVEKVDVTTKGQSLSPTRIEIVAPAISKKEKIDGRS